MSSEEFSRWKLYKQRYPFGYEMQNWRAALIASTVANVAPRKKGAKALKVSDFYPEPIAQRYTPEQRALIRRKKRGNRRHSNN